MRTVVRKFRPGSLQWVPVIIATIVGLMKKSDPSRATVLRNTWSVKLIGISFWGHHQTPVTWRNRLKHCSHILHTYYVDIFTIDRQLQLNLQVSGHRQSEISCIGDETKSVWVGRDFHEWMNDTLQFVTNAPKRRKKKTGNLDMQAGKHLQVECGRKFPHLSKITSTPLWSLLLLFCPLEYYKHKQLTSSAGTEKDGTRDYLIPQESLFLTRLLSSSNSDQHQVKTTTRRRRRQDTNQGVGIFRLSRITAEETPLKMSAGPETI